MACWIIHKIGYYQESINKSVPLWHAGVSADLDPSRFWIPYDVTHCLGMRSSLKCRKVTYKMCVAHPRKWIRFLLASTVLADLDGQNLRFCERRPSFESARLVCVCSYNNMQCKLLQVSLLISQFLLRYIGVCLNKHYSLKVYLIVSFHEHSLWDWV